MNDGKYLFISDVKERKTIARNSRYKKNGCKSKKCTLPSDYMTRKEIAAMNGECVTCNFNKFHTWSEFQKFKDSTKIDYIESLASKYKCSLDAIGTVVFGLSSGALSNYVHKNGLSIKIDKVRGQAGKMGKCKLYADVNEQRGQGWWTRGGDVNEQRGQGSNQNTFPIFQIDGKNIKLTSPIQISSMEITMDSFDQDTFDLIKSMFIDKSVIISIKVQEVLRYKC